MPEKNIGYFGINFPMDVCRECEHKGTFNSCPSCGSTSVMRLRRVSGYLSEDAAMTVGKHHEMLDRRANNGEMMFSTNRNL